MLRRCGAALALLAALCLPALVIAPPASAHARYKQSDPAPNAVLASAPAAVKVWFTEAVRMPGSTLKVVDSSGGQVDLGNTARDAADRTLLSVGLRPLANGLYTVQWRSISDEDGDDAEGSFQFSVGPAANAQPAASGHTGQEELAMSQNPSPVQLHIATPANGATVTGTNVAVQVETRGGQLGAKPEEGHLHISLDGQEVMGSSQPTFTIPNVPPGRHTLEIEYADNAHTFHTTESVQFTVVAGAGIPAAAPPAAQPRPPVQMPGMAMGPRPTRMPRTGEAPAGPATGWLAIAGSALVGGLALRRRAR